MSVQKSLETLVWLQWRELELHEIGKQMQELAQLRADLEAEIQAAEECVRSAEEDLEDSRAEGRRMELDLQSAEEKVRKFKDHIHDVKTNEELWALQKQIDTAKEAVGGLEEKILEQLESNDEVEARIGVRKRELAEVTEKVESGRTEADERGAELVQQRGEVEAAISELRDQLPADLLRRYEDVKKVRAGVAVAEVVNEICQACHVKLRPQLYVETLDLSEIHGCETCNRILFIRDTLSIPEWVMAEKSAGRSTEATEATATNRSDTA